MKGIAIFYKPKGWTSYDVIRYLKRRLKENKIGHGGTLDPLAEGVLIIGIKKEGTKQLTQFLKGTEKEYIASIILGAVSDTYDKEGKITYITVHRWPTLEEIKEALKQFQGEITQTPPPFSAIKISGKPAYKLAREGKTFSLKPRKVFVSEIVLLSYADKEFVDKTNEKKQRNSILLKEIKIKLKVKSGFYVRSFANDLGKILNTGALLNELIRTRVGQFSIEEAIQIEDFENQNIELYFKAYGRVQGVGFRFFAQKWASYLGINGKAENLNDGGIEIIAQGNDKSLQEFLDKILQGPELAKVERAFYYFRKPKKRFIDFEIY